MDISKECIRQNHLKLLTHDKTKSQNFPMTFLNSCIQRIDGFYIKPKNVNGTNTLRIKQRQIVK